ncbi:GHMP kinase, partial [candidate division KSB1 bacterium]|nr:GHMP kinase [candidate division KSB1 bacterium]
MRESIRVSAPGKLMLLGEHAVLHGKHALVCAVDQRLRLTLTPKPDNTLTIHSELGTYTSALTHLEADSRFRFLIAACEARIHEFPSGAELKVESDFSHRVGLGSSAA